MDALSDWAEPHELAEWEPTLTCAKGLTQAMRTIWSSVVKAADHAADLNKQAASIGKEVITDEAN